MRKATTIIMIILLLLALFVFYDFGVPHNANIGPTFQGLGGYISFPLNYSGSYSPTNYSALLADYHVLVGVVSTLNSSFHLELANAYHDGLTIGIFAGLFVGFLFGAVLEGIKRKAKST